MGHLDAKQPPMKRKPYAQILAIPFVHKVELIIPKGLYELLGDDLESRFPTPVYSRVILPLEALLEGDFFDEYIKKGNILMLSEGTYGVDNVFSLKEGILTMSVDMETYERAGLVGKPEGAKTKGGKRSRWIIEVNLRLPQMLRGKKGFDRVVYAFKNVLTKPMTWAFINLQAQALSSEPIHKHFPVTATCRPTILPGIKVRMPRLLPQMELEDKSMDEFNDFSVDLYEWLSLISLESPRVNINDKIDPFLSRYSPPEPDPASPKTEELVKITWEGFLSPSWAYTVFVQALLAATVDMWFSFAVLGFNESLPSDSTDCTVLRLPGQPGQPSEYILWEVDQR